LKNNVKMLAEMASIMIPFCLKRYPWKGVEAGRNTANGVKDRIKRKDIFKH